VILKVVWIQKVITVEAKWWPNWNWWHCSGESWFQPLFGSCYVGMKETFKGNSRFQISAEGIVGMVTIFKLIFMKPAIIMG
jgi:hypothetical protein